MRKINLIVVFVAFISFSYLDSINGLMFVSFRRFHSGYNKPQNSEEINSQDDFNQIAPEPFLFPAFWDNFRPRTVNYLKSISEEPKNNSKKRTSEEIKDVKTTPFLGQNNKTVNFEDDKVHGSYHVKMSNVTGNITEQIFTTATSHYAKIKFDERLPKPSFFDRMFQPLVTIRRLRYFNSRHSKNRKRPEYEEKAAEKQNTSRIHRLNDTDVAMQNSSMMKEEEDCLKHYFMVRIIRTTPAVLDILLLLSLLFVLLATFLGCIHYSKKQPENGRAISKTATTSITKPLTV